MKRAIFWQMAGFIFAVVAGTLLHFLFGIVRIPFFQDPVPGGYGF